MRIRHFASYLVCLFAVSTAPGAEEAGIHLHGIIGISTTHYALLQVNSKAKRAKGIPPEVPMPMLQQLMMLARNEGQNEVEVLAIDPDKGEVEVRNGSNVFKVSLPADTPPGRLVTAAKAGERNAEEVPFLRLGQTSLSEYLHLYQELARRTLIRPTSLPTARMGGLYSKDAVMAADVVKAMDQELGKSGIVMVPDGNKFVVAVVSGMEVKSTMAKLREVREFAAFIERTRSQSPAASAVQVSPASAQKPGPVEQLEIPAGMINFPNTDLAQILPIFGHLTGRVVIQPAVMMSPTIALVTHSGLRQEEVTYAMAAAFAVNGFSVAAAGEKFVLVFPTSDHQKYGDLLKRKGPLDYAAMTNMIPAGMFALPTSDLPVFAGLYGKLAGRPVEIGDGLPRLQFNFNPAMPLTTGEALQGMDWLFGVNGLKVIEAENGGRLKIVKSTDNP